jgi:starch synthase
VKVLFGVSECVPFVKSGGLADVAGSLPKELKRLGTDVRVMMPKYGTIPQAIREKMTKKHELIVSVGWREQYCGIEEYVHDGITYYFIDNEYYFKRDSLYGYFDDGERFAFFNRAVLEAVRMLDYYPDVIHCHDWHTGMIPFLLKTEYQKKNGYGFMRTVFTIHNLGFQGIMPKEALKDLFNLNDSYFNTDQLEFFGNINFMKAALIASDRITTVSPTYMDEIQTEYYGEKLDGLLRSRVSDLEGILNGIDDEFYNPEKDSFLVKTYDANRRNHKLVNKKAIQKRFGLTQASQIPLMVMVTRLTKQKGLDLVKHVFNEIMAEPIQFLILGTGDDEFENFFRDMERQYPDRFKAYIGFDEGLAHQIYAGADLFLMPSKFEPCGLGQMIAMRYGAIPIVRETGGLNDTVFAYDEFSGEGNGFSFKNFNAHDMLYTIKRAIHFYENDRVWNNLVKHTMSIDNSWAQSAFKYNQSYAQLISRSETHVF